MYATIILNKEINFMIGEGNRIKTFIEYQIEKLKDANILDIVIIGKIDRALERSLRDGSQYGVNLTLIKEDQNVGSAGMLYHLKDRDDDFVLLYGDTIFDVDFDKFYECHNNANSYITILTHPNTTPDTSDVLIVEKNKVLDVLPREEKRNYLYKNLVDSNLYIVNKKALNYIKEPNDLRIVDLIGHFISLKLVYAYKSSEYVRRVYDDNVLEEVEDDMRNGIVSIKNLKNKQRCIFVDRDGTLNDAKGFITKIEDFKLYDCVSESIKRLNKSGYLVIVITNQPIIAKGECSKNIVEKIHMKLEDLLGDDGAYVDDIAYCPHYPDKGITGEIGNLTIECDCRKPKTGMIDKMVELYNIDLEQSWFVGDMTIDVKTGKNANLKTILVQTGFAGSDKKYFDKPDYTAKDLKEAVNIILDDWR